jgi:hypothetical protein
LTDSQHILQTLAYFDVFRYPVSIPEIQQYCGVRINRDCLEKLLLTLLQQRVVFRHGEWYALSADPALADRRRSGNQRAAQLLPTAYRIGRWLYRFPFVRAVGISGSLSKHYADPDADIDFFIITAPGRLWIARTLLHLLKKISYLAGRQHWFCMNYFIDERALRIAEQNRFTATEIFSLLPVKGNTVFSAFYRENRWASEILPNAVPAGNGAENTDGWLKRFAETVFRMLVFDWLEKKLMQITVHRWNKKAAAAKRNSKGECMRLIMTAHTARPDPACLQTKIMNCFLSKSLIWDEHLGTEDIQQHYFLQKEII